MARAPKRAPAARPLTTRSQRWLAKHPGASNPRSKNYDPNWLQKSRGHKPAEHVIRRERELATTGLTNYERSVIRKIAYRQAGRMNQTETRVDPDEVNRRLQLWAREKGFARVQELRDRIKQLEKTKRHRVRVRRKIGGRVIRVEITGASSNVGTMQSAFADFDLPDLPDDLPEWFWFFYH